MSISSIFVYLDTNLLLSHVIPDSESNTRYGKPNIPPHGKQWQLRHIGDGKLSPFKRKQSSDPIFMEILEEDLMFDNVTQNCCIIKLHQVNIRLHPLSLACGFTVVRKIRYARSTAHAISAANLNNSAIQFDVVKHFCYSI